LSFYELAELSGVCYNKKNNFSFSMRTELLWLNLKVVRSLSSDCMLEVTHVNSWFAPKPLAVLLKGQSNGSQSTCVPFWKHDRWTSSCPVSAHRCVKWFLTFFRCV